MPDKNVRKTTSDGDLRLTGDKIKLEERPSGKESRASSKYPLLSYRPSRPVSAVPLLMLYEEEYYDNHFKTRRPVSAPFIDSHANSSSLQIIAKSTFADMKDKLPSTDLFKTLLSEPISSWENASKTNVESKAEKVVENVRNNTAETDLEEDLSIRSCTSGSSEQSLGAKIQEVAQNGFTKSKPNTIVKSTETFESYQLVPGVTGKPPIPRKKDDKIDNRKPMKSSQKNNFLIDYTNYTDDLKDCISFDYPKDVFEDVLLNKKNTSLQIENNLQIIESKTYEIMITDNTSDYESRGSTTESNYETHDNTVQYQNWILDEDEARKRENETDLYLKSLRKQNEEIQELIKRSEVALEKDDAIRKGEDYEKKTNAEKNYEEKFDKFFRKEVEPQNPIDESEQCQNETSSKPKPNKVNKVTNPKTPKNGSSNGKKSKKFVATPMRHYKEYQEKELPEIESWMSQNHETATQTSISISKANAKADYSEVLDSLKELEDVVKGENDIETLDEIPQLDKVTEDKHEDDQPGYDDINSILEVLEAQDLKSQKKMESIKEIVNSELSTTKVTTKAKRRKDPPSVLLDNSPKKSKDVAESNTNSINKRQNVEVINPTNVSTSSLNSSTNYNNILSFLDEVERNSCKTLNCAKERVNTVTKMLENTLNLDTVPQLEDLLSHNNEELSKQIIDLTLRLKEKSSSIKLLQDELSTLRDQIIKMTKQTDEVVKLKLKAQKDEFESIVKRHQKFIDQLIADKKALNQQCEGLLNEIKVQEDRHNSNIKAMEHKHKVELQKVKDMQIAGEKIRRERWIDNKTQKIKEMTVKSIEPELQNMTSRHQQEIADLRSLHKREIEDLELKAARKTQQQCELLREQLSLEREKAIAHEREILRQRYDAMVESEEKGYQDQRRRLQHEHANRIQECEERETLAIAERDRAIKLAQEEFNDKLQVIIRRHNNEIKLLKEKADLEMETWKTNYIKQQNVQLSEKETHIREYYRKERDREIENVIERLENEATETKKQIEQTTENRIRRIKEKYDNEIRDLELSEKESKTKYNEIKTKLLEAENIVLNLTNNIKQLEQQLRESQEFAKQLSDDRNRMKDIVKEEVKDELEQMQNEIEILKQDKEKEMQQVYSRVRVTVARKDELLAELTRDHAALQEKCTYLENMLEQQRKEYLMK